MHALRNFTSRCVRVAAPFVPRLALPPRTTSLVALACRPQLQPLRLLQVRSRDEATEGSEAAQEGAQAVEGAVRSAQETVDHGLDMTKRRATTAYERAAESADRTIAGAQEMTTEDIDTAKDTSRTAAGKTKQAAGETAQQARGAYERAKGAIDKGTEMARESAMGAAQQTAGAVRKGADKTRETAQSAYEQAKGLVGMGGDIDKASGMPKGTKEALDAVLRKAKEAAGGAHGEGKGTGTRHDTHGPGVGKPMEYAGGAVGQQGAPGAPGVQQQQQQRKAEGEEDVAQETGGTPGFDVNAVSSHDIEDEGGYGSGAGKAMKPSGPAQDPKRQDPQADIPGARKRAQEAGAKAGGGAAEKPRGMEQARVEDVRAMAAEATKDTKAEE